MTKLKCDYAYASRDIEEYKILYKSFSMGETENA